MTPRAVQTVFDKRLQLLLRIMLLCFYMLLLCNPARSENAIIFKKSNESMTLKCSSNGCQKSNVEYRGLYMYHHFPEKKEVLFVNFQTPDTVVPRERYEGRIETKGPPKDLIITISNLSVNDSGVYSCVYEKIGQRETCKVYAASIEGNETAQCFKTKSQQNPSLKPSEKGTDSPLDGAPSNTVPCTTEMSLPMAVLIAVACIITVVVMFIFLKIITKVKQWHGSRTRSTPRVSNEYVYEDMRNNRQFVAAPEQS